MDNDQLINLINNLLLNNESEYLEFKVNFDKKIIGERISAISNSALLSNREFGYILLGIDDKTHKVVGTKFNPEVEKVGNVPIKNWFAQKIEPKIDISFIECEIKGDKVILIKIPAAMDRPVSFDKVAYIRVGETTKKLCDFPDKERQIWNNSKNRNFEKGIALDDLTADQVLKMLDYDKYFQLTGQNLPTETKQFLDKLKQDKIVKKQDNANYSITILGAILLARNIQEFEIIRRKTIRVITYKGNTREERKKEQEGAKGYAVGFDGLLDYLSTQIPNNEQIKKALRIEKKMYPEIALREFIANALIHQDFSISGAGPMIEIFDNKIEIINPGMPLIEVNRFIDHSPKSRNEDLASLMRRFGFCEECGSGIDRALINIELFQLPAPKFETYDDFTKVTLFAYKTLKEMSSEDKVRACYQHCVLKYLNGTEKMTNRSLRDRLMINESNYPAASKIIADSIKKGLIKESEKSKEYIPWWA